MAEVRLDLSGIGIRLAELPESLARRLHEEWGAFFGDPGGIPLLDLRVQLLDSGKSAPEAAFRPKRMESSFGAAGAVFRMPQGRARVGTDGRGTIELLRGSGPAQTPYYAMHNLLRGCLAWRMPERHGALVHAAGLVVADRAFLLVGPSGSGKTTWARLGREAGARVIGDDLVLLDGTRGEIEALGSPFRSYHVADYRPGRWTVGAVCFPHRGRPARWSGCEAAKARSRILANLPFISTALERDPRIVRIVEALSRDVPCRELTFDLDGSFVELLRAEGRGRPT